MIAVGDVYVAPWGRYAVRRLDPDDQVVLADLARPNTASVLTTVRELAAMYELVSPAAPGAAEIAEQPSTPSTAPLGRRTNCDDCGATSRVLWHQGDPDDPKTLRFCGPCLWNDEAAKQKQKADAQALAGPTSWRPEPGEVYESRAEVGSYDPPATPAAPRRRWKPKATREEAASLWPVETIEVAR